MHEELLVPFLRGVGPDADGRFHVDILKFSDEELEETHDYIQWLFPLCEPSMAVPGSPYLVDEEVISILKGDEDVQENIGARKGVRYPFLFFPNLKSSKKLRL